MIDFMWSKMLFLIPLPLIIRAFIPTLPRIKGEAMKIPFFTDIRNIKHIRKKYKLNQSNIIVSLLYLIWIFLVIASARPSITAKPLILNNKSRDLMLVLDISGSMSIPDYAIENQNVDRLLVAQKVSSDFIEKRISDRIGLILFGTRPYLYVPLTLDKTTATKMLFSAFPGMAGPQTATGDALGLAVKHLYERETEQKAIVLLSDGYSNIGNLKVEQAVKLAAKNNIKIYTIAFGSNKKSLKTSDGVVIENLQDFYDEDELKQIANTTGGVFFKAETTEELIAIYQAIDQLEPLNEEDVIINPKIDIYHYPLTIALILSFLTMFIFFRRRKAI